MPAHLCPRTPTEIAVTGVGYCDCRHRLLRHDAAGCGQCRARHDRPRLYRGSPAAYTRRLPGGWARHADEPTTAYRKTGRWA